jgi:hypothetical protein
VPSNANTRILPFDRFWAAPSYLPSDGPFLPGDTGALILLHLASNGMQCRDHALNLQRIDECFATLTTPLAAPPYGARRRTERARKQEAVLVMIAEGLAIEEQYCLGRTRREAAEVMKLTTRQMRTREQLLQKVTDYFGLGWKTGPRFRGRPPHRTLERELETAA